MKSTTNKGFTLIELLVVIAIIGILSGIAIFGLSDARKKGQDAAAIAALGQIPAQAAIFYDDGNTYTGVCASTNVAAALTDAEGAANGASECFGNDSAFAASVELTDVNDASTDVYCVDSAGFNGKIAALTAADAVACN